MPAAKEKAPRKPTLSPTKLNTYLLCRMKYRYTYIDKIGRFYQRARSYYSFGATLHNVLQEFHEQGATHTAQELQVELDQKWISAGYDTPTQALEHKETGEKIVQAYHEAHQERIVAQVETLFTEKTITTDLGPFKLTGRIDRIDRHPDGSLEIVDYKSGRMETTSEQVANDLAMNCYHLILSKLYPDTPISTTIYCLRSGVSATAAQDAEFRAEFEREVIMLGEEILATDYAELHPVPVEECPECEYLAVCTRYWKKQAKGELLDAPHRED